MIVVLALAVAYNLPHWFEREVVWETDSCTGLPADVGTIKKVGYRPS